MLKSERGIIQSNFDRILCKVYQVIYIIYLNCMPDIMILAILFTRLLYYTKCQSRKREISQSNSFRILPKVNQVIYTLDTICEPNIMILAQPVLAIFCSQGSIGLQWERQKKSEKGHNSRITIPMEMKNQRTTGPVSLTCVLKIC